MDTKKPWNTQRFREKSGGYQFLYGGQKIFKLKLSAGEIELDLWDDFSTVISLGMKFDFVQHGQTRQLNAEDVVSLAPLLQLIGCEIESIVAGKSGFLHLRFSNKIEIQVPSDAGEFRFEAWQIADKHGFLAVCAVGGTVSIWDPHLP